DGGGRRGDHAAAAAGGARREPARGAGDSPAGGRSRLPHAGAGLAAHVAPWSGAQADRRGDPARGRPLADRAGRRALAPAEWPLDEVPAAVAAARRSSTSPASAASRSAGFPRRIEAGWTV